MNVWPNLPVLTRHPSAWSLRKLTRWLVTSLWPEYQATSESQEKVMTLRRVPLQLETVTSLPVLSAEKPTALPSMCVHVCMCVCVYMCMYACVNYMCCIVSIACLQSQIDTGEHSLQTGAFSCGMPIFVWVLINAMWLLKSKWVPIFMGCLFCVGAYYPDFTVII